MEKINRNIRIYFWVSLALTLGFPAGVLGIVFGAVNKIIPLLIVGILFAVAGFYVMPIMWIKYGEKRHNRTIISMILHDNIYTVADLSAQSGDSEKVIREKLKQMILSRELTGYLLEEDTLVVNTNAKQSGKTRMTRKCVNCGANMQFDGVKFVCEYCKSVAKK